MANGRSPKHLSLSTSYASCTRDTQSMVFLTSGGTDELYSGVTITHAMMGANIMRLRLIAGLRHAGFGLQVAVIDRQRKIAQRDARHVGARLRELIRLPPPQASH